MMVRITPDGTSSQSDSIYWATRILEFFAIFSSLLWAVEATAMNRDLATIHRSLATMRVSHDRSKLFETKSVTKKSHLSQWIAPMAVYSGQSLAPTFVQSPIYAPTSWVLVRFSVSPLGVSSGEK